MNLKKGAVPVDGATKLRGVYTLEHRDAKGNLKSYERIFNTITDAGRAGVALLVQGQGNPAEGFKFIGLGSSSTAAVVGDTTLASEITSPSLLRITSTASRTTTSVANDTSNLVHTFSSTATQAVQEVGVFNSATVSGSTIVSRKTFAAKNLVSGDTLQVTHTIQVT